MGSGGEEPAKPAPRREQIQPTQRSEKTVRDVTAPLASTLLAAALLLLAPAAAQAAASPWSENGPSRVRLVTPWQTAPAAGEFRLGLHFRTEPGWHVYWKNSGDAGYAPTVSFAEAPGLTKPELLWPAPHRFDLPGGLVAFGYEGEVVYPLRARLETQGDRLQLTADVDYLVCEVDCIPYRSTLALTQPLGPPVVDAETAPLVDTWWARVPRPAGDIPGVRTETLLAAEQGKPVLEVRLHGIAADPRTAGLFLESHELVDAGRPAARALADGIAFRVPLTPRVVGKAPAPGSVFAWTVTGLTPAADRTGGGSSLEARQPAVAALAAEAAEAAENTPPGAGRENVGAATRSRGGLAEALAQAFLGGLLLAAAPSTLATMLAVALCWRTDPRMSWDVLTSLVLAGWLCLSAAAPNGWAKRLPDPAFTALLAAIALLVALVLWGLLQRPRWSASLLARLAVWPAALLLLAWPSPPLERAFDLTQPPRGPFSAVALAAALGLGLPWVALAAIPALRNRLPVTEDGARRLREGLGFLAAGSALWLLYLLSREIDPVRLAFVQLALVAAALLAWLLRRPRRNAAAALLAAGLAAALLAAPWLAGRSAGPLALKSPTGVPERPSIRNP